MSSLSEIITSLQQEKVVAYPTEAVFGLGCNPYSEKAVERLLLLKQRPLEKGLILIASTRELLLPFIDENRLTEVEWQRFSTRSAHPITWVMPAKPDVPRYLTGMFDTIAVRVCDVPAVKHICEQVGFALTSTSANLTGLMPCRTADEVRLQFGAQFPVLDGETGGVANPSEIRDIFTQHIFRQG